MAITELEKPREKWCNHCAKGSGCTIYDQRPQSCRDFECVWLQTQSKPGHKMAPELRPDRCHVVLATTDDGKTIIAHADSAYADAGYAGKMGALLRHLIAQGAGVIIASGHRRDAFLPKCQPIRFYDRDDSPHVTNIGVKDGRAFVIEGDSNG